MRNMNDLKLQTKYVLNLYSISTKVTPLADTSRIAAMEDMK